MCHRLCAVVSLLALFVATGHAAETSWTGTWATAAQGVMPGRIETFDNQTVRLIVHVSAGGKRVRIRLSNTFGDRPLRVRRTHIARRTRDAGIDPASDRALTFGGKPVVGIPPHAEVFSDPVDLEVPTLSDLAISLFLAQPTPASTSHALALQTSYVSAPGDHTAAATLPVAKKLSSWPFLTGVDVTGPQVSVVAFGSSHTDGDGSTDDANHRWPDLLADRLQKAGLAIGVLNEGIIGNRLLNDSPRSSSSPFGSLLGESGLRRFDRDVLSQSGVKVVITGLGVNDILFPSFPFTPPEETVTVDQLVAGYRELITRAHAKGIRVIGSTVPPFEGATFDGFDMKLDLYTPDRDRKRVALNEWIRNGGAFDGIVDFDAVLRDPARPTRISPRFAVEDGLHVNDAGNAAQADAIPLDLLRP